MANTTNYNWETPDDTDLVKDGAAAIRTLGNSIDTTTKNLNPETTTGDIAYRSATANTNTRLAIGTTGQVLTVAAGVPSWATPTDQTPLTTKGDVFTFSTVDARLGVGANGTVLTADSAETTGLKWAAPAGGGKVLQVVTATTTTETTVSSTTYTDTTLTASITPSAASSKVLILIAQQITANRVSDNAGGGLRILRGATNIIDYSPNGYESIFVSPTGATQVVYRLLFNASYLDSPSTTSSTTYKTQIKAFSTANSGYIQAQQNGSPTTSSIILLEIGA
jgi:hypothetical protein